MKRLILAVTGCLLMAAPAQADTIVKRIRTSKVSVVRHIRTTSYFRGSDGAPANSITHIRCKGYHFNRAHKAKTWRCTYRYAIAGQVCSGRYHGGFVRVRLDDGRTGTEWRDDPLDKRCP